MKKISIICLYTILSISVSAQTESKENPYAFLNKILCIQDSPPSPILPFPVITIGSGLLSYHGDIQSQYKKNISIGLPAIQIELLQQVSQNYSFGFRFLKGNITENYYIPNTTTQLNFKTHINSFGAFLHYDITNKSQYAHYDNRVFAPYVSIGIEALQRAESWGDLYHDSILYHQWKDGTTRNIAESKYNTSRSEIVYRDFIFESSYQKENIDNIEYFSPITLSFPLEIGVTMKLSPKIQMQMGYQYHISTSNKLDNIHNKGNNYNETPFRKGNNKPDGFSYAYVSLRFDITAKKPSMFINDTSKIQFYDFWDADNDGIDETEDECPYTPPGVKVFADGCPFDDDKDGVPNYRDKEPNTQNAFYVNADGIGVSEEEILSIITNQKVVDQRDIYRFYPKLLNGGTVYKQFYKKIPSKYKSLDTDKNEYIDIEELLYAIDSFFDEGPNAGAGSQLGVKDLFELIEFFFLQ